MQRQCILAIDQGTTNTKAVLVDRAGAPILRTGQQITLLTTPNGFAEQDPESIWDSVVQVAETAVAFAQTNGCSIQAIAISNQRETALAWDANTGRAVAPAISWQCGRGADICKRVSAHASKLRAKTGLPLAPLASATKWAWLLENNSTVRDLSREGLLRFGTVDAWLVHKFTAGTRFSSDLTNASRTGLLNLAQLEWDRDILGLFGIPSESLPGLEPSSHCFGLCETIPSVRGVPIMSVIGDSHAAMFGHGRYGPGSIKATYGTGSSLMALTSALPKDTNGLARTIAWSIGGTTQYALEGNIPMTGSAIQWLGEFLELDDPTADLVELAEEVEDSLGVVFVPAMVGLGAPYWDADARGAILGLGRHHSKRHVARAAVDCIAYQIADVFFAMEEASDTRFAELQSDGAATRNSRLMQFQADVLNRPVVRALNEELSAIGAAWLTGLTLGWWTTRELEALASDRNRFEPLLDTGKRDALYRGWLDAVQRVRSSKAVYA